MISLSEAFKRSSDYLLALLWSFVGAAGTGAIDALDDIQNYEWPPDWQHMKKVAATGALLGVVAFLRKQRALYAEPPSNKPPSASSIPPPPL